MHTTYNGHKVIDDHGETIGTVTDVFYDDAADEPTWLVVDPGILRKERMVPIEGSYETADGRIVVPFDRQWLKHAPVVDSHHYPDDVPVDEANEVFHTDD